MTHLNEPVVVFSDVHLHAGSDWQKALRRLRHLWADAATVIFNGDTMNRDLASDEARRLQIVQALTDMCAADGTDAVFLAGNSDYCLAAPRHAFLAEGRVLVTHGDAIIEEISPWNGRGSQIAAAGAEALARMPPERRCTLEGRLAAATEAIARTRHILPARRQSEGTASQRTACYLSWLKRPWALATVLSFWRRMPRLAAEFLSRYADQARMIVLGHAHRRGVWTVDGRWVVNTGSLEGFWGRALVVRVEGRRVDVRRVVRRKGCFLPGPTIARYDVSGGRQP